VLGHSGFSFTANGGFNSAYSKTYNPNARWRAYNHTNLNLGYQFMPDLRLQLSLQKNLFDHRSMTPSHLGDHDTAAVVV
jgi:hypothetical protein